MRRRWLQKQLLMNGVFTITYDDSGVVPVEYQASGYAGKLLLAFRVAGGEPEKCMLLRNRDQPVFKTRNFQTVVQEEGGTSGGFSDVYTSGRRERGTQRFDRDLGIKVEKVKGWQIEAIKRKREHLEMKIRRALDYSDQLQQEIDRIDVLLSEGRGSAADLILEAEIQSSTPGSMNVVQNLNDIFGLFIGRPGALSFDDALLEEDERDQRAPA